MSPGNSRLMTTATRSSAMMSECFTHAKKHRSAAEKRRDASIFSESLMNFPGLNGSSGGNLDGQASLHAFRPRTKRAQKKRLASDSLSGRRWRQDNGLIEPHPPSARHAARHDHLSHRAAAAASWADEIPAA